MTTMEMTRSQLTRQKKDTLIEQVMSATKKTEELNEKILAAAVAGGFVGTLLGLALATL